MKEIKEVKELTLAAVLKKAAPHVTKGQHAMAVARIYPDGGKPAPGKRIQQEQRY